MHSSKALIKQYFKALSGKNDTPITNYFSPNIRWNLPQTHPFGGPFVGVAEVLEMMEKGAVFFQYESIQINLRELLAENNNVVAHFTLTAKTHRDEVYENDYLFRFKCEGGEIIEVWEFFDTYYQASMGVFTS